MKLNQGQSKAFLELTEFIEGKTENKIKCLKGYAGTGKTFLITKVIEHILSKHPKWKIAATAPTNKAVQVLRDSSKIKEVTFKTIHSLLGLQESILDSGEIEFKRSYNESADDLSNFKVLIVDEVSMLDDNLFMEIRRYNNRVKIILMGDPAQIPPVNKDDCEPFLNPVDHGIDEIVLTEIMRQADGSKIAESGMMIRNDLTCEKYFFESGSDQFVFNMPEKRIDLMEEFKKSYKSNPDAKVIAWTNRKVDEYNRYIRRIFFGENPPQISIGERMIVNKPCVASFRDEEFLLNTNQEVKIESFSNGSIKIPFTDESVRVCQCNVSFVGKSGKIENGIINVLDDFDRRRFWKEIESLKQDAIKSNFSERKQKWEEYYKAMSCVADITYSYAITAHKSQGSTYNECFVDLSNISLNQKIVERNRILYTAITRAKSKLIIIC